MRTHTYMCIYIYIYICVCRLHASYLEYEEDAFLFVRAPDSSKCKFYLADQMSCCLLQNAVLRGDMLMLSHTEQLHDMVASRNRQKPASRNKKLSVTPISSALSCGPSG